MGADRARTSLRDTSGCEGLKGRVCRLSLVEGILNELLCSTSLFLVSGCVGNNEAGGYSPAPLEIACCGVRLAFSISRQIRVLASAHGAHARSRRGQADCRSAPSARWDLRAPA